MIQKSSEIAEVFHKDNVLKQRMDNLSPRDRRLVFAEIMKDFNVSRNTVYRWLRLNSKDLPIVLLNYGVPRKQV
jgi:hypothetical protein